MDKIPLCGGDTVATRQLLSQKHVPIKVLHSAAFTVAPCSETPSDERLASQQIVVGIPLVFNSDHCCNKDCNE